MEDLKEFFATSPALDAWLQKQELAESNSTMPVPRNLRLVNSLELISLSGPKLYKVYTIPKKNGGRRTIAHPSKMLKAFQRDLSLYLTAVLPVHEAATAYRTGTSIKKNASAHSKHSYLLRMDLSSFFNSIDTAIFDEELRRHNIKLNSKDLKFIHQCAFWSPTKTSTGHLILSVGAPISPLISNFLMHTFDTIVSDICIQKEITYTRYADDLFFSTNIRDACFKLPELIHYILKKTYKNKLSINQTKTRFSSKAHNRHITGITLTNEDKLSLGRQRKRLISSMIHRRILNNLNKEDTKRLQGLLSYANHIEPTFILSMKKKYSESVINSVISGRWENG
jgi:RNA-directed DNA polymerase